MATISAAMVKDLRDKTGAGMMDCKNALTENDGDMEAAIDWLRKKGLAKAAKKSGRVAAEGLVGVAVGDKAAAVVEVNSETDFVARNDGFQKMVSDIAATALTVGGDRDKLAATPYPGSAKSVEDYIVEMVGTIGENMSLRRSAGLAVSSGVVASYVHSAAAEGLGKIGVIVGLESTGDTDKLMALGKQVAMHIAAANPIAVSSAEVDQSVIEREKAIYADQARQSGKPDNIIEKMVEGRVRKFFEEVVLLQQVFVIDGENTVEKALKAAEKDVGGPIKVTGFFRFQLGEGVEKAESDFAAEVAAAAGQG